MGEQLISAVLTGVCATIPKLVLNKQIPNELQNRSCSEVASHAKVGECQKKTRPSLADTLNGLNQENLVVFDEILAGSAGPIPSSVQPAARRDETL